MITDPEGLKGTIIGHRGDRFGGRFAAILTVMRAADITGIPFVICWPTPPDWEEVSRPEDLFSQDFMDRHFLDRKVFNQIRGKALNLYPGTFDRETFDKDIAAGRFYLCENTRARGFPWEDEDEVLADIPRYWSKIGLSDALAALVEKVDAAFEVAEETVAYHIRRGDLVDDHQYNSHRLHSRGKYIPLEIYSQHIEQVLEANPKSQIVIFSDEPRVIATLSERFEQVRGMRDISGALDMTIGQRDYLELYAMSKCPVIVGPPHSAFSASAAMLGNGRVVSVADDLDPGRMQAALDRIAEDFEAGWDRFLCMGDLGQCLPYYLDHLDAKGEGPRANATLRRHFENGFDRSHAYPIFAERYFAEGDFEALAALRKSAEAGLVMFDTVGLVDSYMALAHSLSGDTKAAVQSMNAAIWLEPLSSFKGQLSVTDRAVDHLLGTGVLGPDSLPPFDPKLTWNRRPLFEEEGAVFEQLNALSAPKGHATKIPFEVLARDWMGLAGRRICPAGLQTRFHEAKWVNLRLDRILSRFKDHEDPSILSMLGVFHRGMKNFEEAARYLDRALAEEPDNALFLKRRADLDFETEAPEDGLRRLERARDLAQTIWYDADLAWRMTRNGDPVEARRRTVDLAGRDHPFPSIRAYVAAQLFRRPNQKERSLAEIDAALAQVPGAPGLILLKGRILADMGRMDEAREALHRAAKSREHERQVQAIFDTLEPA